MGSRKGSYCWPIKMLFTYVINCGELRHSGFWYFFFFCFMGLRVLNMINRAFPIVRSSNCPELLSRKRVSPVVTLLRLSSFSYGGKEHGTSDLSISFSNMYIVRYRYIAWCEEKCRENVLSSRYALLVMILCWYLYCVKIEFWWEVFLFPVSTKKFGRQ